jgi:hypothetical protein
MKTELTDQEIHSRLRQFEDHFVERKTSGDSKDWLKTAVAFANSTPIGYPAILFIGVRNDGSLEGGVNFDSLQQTFNRILEDVYPPIYCLSKIVADAGKQCLAVIIPGSPQRPHFAGPSYVREGSQTKKASEAQFTQLISERSGKAYEILKWMGKEITVVFPGVEEILHGTTYRKAGETGVATLAACNQFYVTLKLHVSIRRPEFYSYPVQLIEISFDNVKERLELIFTRDIY